jgi:hypothetical protein
MAAAQRRNRLAAQRARLRQNMGSAVTMTPPMAIPGLRPISPDELIRARDEFLSSGRKSAPAPSDERRDNRQGKLPAGSPDSGSRVAAITSSAFDTSAFDSMDFDDTGLNDTSLDMSFQTVGANDLAHGSFYDIVTVDAADLPQLPQLPQVFVMSHAKIIAKTPGNIGYDTREPVNPLPGSKGTLFGTPGGVVNSENLVLPASPVMQPSTVQPSAPPSAAFTATPPLTA